MSDSTKQRWHSASPSKFRINSRSYTPTFYIASAITLLSIICGVLFGLIPVANSENILAIGKVSTGYVTDSEMYEYGVPPVTVPITEAQFVVKVSDTVTISGSGYRISKCGCDPSFADGSRVHWVPGTPVNVHYLSPSEYVFGDSVPDTEWVPLEIFGALAILSLTVAAFSFSIVSNYKQRRAALPGANLPLLSSGMAAQSKAPTNRFTFRVPEDMKPTLKSGPLVIQLVLIALLVVVFVGLLWYYFANDIHFTKGTLAFFLIPVFAFMPVLRRIVLGRSVLKVARTITDSMMQTIEFQRSLTNTLLAAPWSKNQIGFGNKKQRFDDIVFIANGDAWNVSIATDLSWITVNDYRSISDSENAIGTATEANTNSGSPYRFRLKDDLRHRLHKLPMVFLLSFYCSVAVSTIVIILVFILDIFHLHPNIFVGASLILLQSPVLLLMLRKMILGRAAAEVASTVASLAPELSGIEKPLYRMVLKTPWSAVRMSMFNIASVYQPKPEPSYEIVVKSDGRQWLVRLDLDLSGGTVSEKDGGL